ncbi:MAG: MATE family efflux transporter, partial [Spirochaetia bacterium]|nr:MATE family efflux transporter [Spirochaetia bacterium]
MKTGFSQSAYSGCWSSRCWPNRECIWFAFFALPSYDATMHTNPGKDNLSSLLAKLSIPSMIALFSASLYTIADTIFLGRTVGATALAGLGFASPIQLLLVAFAQLFGAGAASVISRALGKRDQDRANRAFSTSAVTLLGVTALFALFFLSLPSLVLSWFGPAGETSEQALLYLSALLPFTPFFTASTFLSAMLRSEGKAGKALSLLLIGNTVNIILDSIFILSLGWGIQGAALATGLGHLVAVSFGLYALMGGKGTFSWSKPSRGLLKEILPLGLPSWIRQVGTGAVIALVNSLLLPRAGSHAVASYTLITQVTMLCYLPLSALVMGFAPIAGFSYGAQDTKRLASLVKLSVGVQLVLGLLLLISLQGFATPILSLFTKDRNLVSSTLVPLRIVLSTIPLVGIQSLGASYFQSIGKSMQS